MTHMQKTLHNYYKLRAVAPATSSALPRELQMRSEFDRENKKKFILLLDNHGLTR